MRTFTLLSALLAVALSPLLRAQDDEAAYRKKAQAIADGLKYQKGEITLKGGLAKIAVPDDFRYLDAKDADTVLTKIWGNPKGSGTLGMLVPASVSPAANESWAVIITYDEDGYVKDDEAAKLDYNKLLKEMQEGTAEANKERQKEGYPGIELVGWATPPRYDAATHKMYWAKELKFEGSGGTRSTTTSACWAAAACSFSMPWPACRSFRRSKRRRPRCSRWSISGRSSLHGFQLEHRQGVAAYGLAPRWSPAASRVGGFVQGLLVALGVSRRKSSPSCVVIASRRRSSKKLISVKGNR